MKGQKDFKVQCARFFFKLKDPRAMLLSMAKGEIKVAKKKKSKDYVTFESQLSNDKRTFVTRVESTSPENWYTFLMALRTYADDEIKRYETPDANSPQ